MENLKHRLNVTFSPDIEAEIRFLAQIQHKSMACVVRELTEKALEYDDDAFLCKLVREIEKESEGMKPISMQEFWKRNDERKDEEYE